MGEGLRRGGLILLSFILLLGMNPATAFSGEFGLVSPEELKGMIDRGDQGILVVDTQPRKAYETGHIQGAVNFPWAMSVPPPGGDLPYDKVLIIYCDCPQEEDSIDVARQLKEKWSYEKIKLLKGGWSRWKELGYAVEKK